MWSQEFADQQKWNITQTIISSLSIFGSVTIIITYFLFQDLQSTARKFLVYISIGDFFTVFPYLIVAWVDHENSSLNCRVQSFVTTTAVMWSFFWTSALAIYLYLVIVKKNQERAEKLMPYFHVVNWGIPLALVGAAWGNDMLGSGQSGDSGGWCWITLGFGLHKGHKAIWWMLACGKFWEILSYFIDVVLCFIIARKINAEVKERHGLSSESTQVAMQGKRKLIWAPVLFVLLRIWGTIRFLWFVAEESPRETMIEKILIVCHIIGDSSQGFVYFILFCLCTPIFRENVRKMLCSSSKTKSVKTERKGRPSSSSKEHKYLLQNPENIVFYT